MRITANNHEPHKIKTVRLIPFPSLEERKRALADAFFNVFNLCPSQISFDMCSLGTSASSEAQFAGQFLGDEAYAGARSFTHLQDAVRDVLGHRFACPTHNVLGCVKLVVASMIPAGGQVPSNARTRADVLTPREVKVPDVRDGTERVFTGNVQLERLAEVLDRGKTALVGIQTFADGQHPISLANLRAVRDLADRHGVPVVVDGSRVVENAWYVQRHEQDQRERSIAQIVKSFAELSHVFQIDGAQAPKGPTGGVLSTNNEALYDRFCEEVVVYEGLHTSGGMTGRAMEVLAIGIREMCDEQEVHWVMRQTEAFTAKLRQAGVPLERGCDGAYLRADDFLPHLTAHQEHALSAALYHTAGIRAVAMGLVGRDALVPVQIPRLAMTNRHLEQIADAIISLFEQRDRVAALEPVALERWHDQLRFRSVFGALKTFPFDIYPYLIQTTQPIARTSRQQRERAIHEAGYNTFLLPADVVTIDLLTDSGTSAMSTDQWAAFQAAKASAATTDAYRLFVRTLRDVLGYEHIIPTHQGRAAEHILSQTLIKPGQIVPGNMYYTTTKHHQEMAGGVFVDVIVDQAHDPTSDFPWKGNIDLEKLARVVETHGPDRVAYVSFEHSVNMAGGQPVDMANMRDVYAYCRGARIPVFFDATRAVENAYMIQARNPLYQNTRIRDILREMMLYADGCTLSGKKDFLTNIGGLLAFKDNAAWKHRAQDLLRLNEGNVADGGLCAADLAASARGVEEMLDDRYIRSRVQQTERLGILLLEAGIPIVRPPGTHAIFLDARRFLPHVNQDLFPAQHLAAELYVETGARTAERGTVSMGRNPQTGQNFRPSLELVRLTIPRRVFTDEHMRFVAEGLIRLQQRRESIRGLRFVHEPPQLRLFQARFEPIP